MLHNDKEINPTRGYNSCKHLCTPGAPKYIKQRLMGIKGNINRNTIIAGAFITPLTPVDRSSRQKIKRETAVLSDTLDQMEFIDIFSAFHCKAQEYIFLSSEHETFSRIDHMLDHKTSLNKFKKIESISSIFSDHNTIKLEMNYKKKIEKHTTMWRLNNWKILLMKVFYRKEVGQGCH